MFDIDPFGGKNVPCTSSWDSCIGWDGEKWPGSDIVKYFDYVWNTQIRRPLQSVELASSHRILQSSQPASKQATKPGQAGQAGLQAS